MLWLSKDTCNKKMHIKQAKCVCVHDVMKALKELCSRALYKAQNICINENWNNVLGSKTLKTDSEFDTSDESKNGTLAETLVHGFTDSQ